MELFQVDEAGKLFISPVITCWDTIEGHGVDVVIDLEGDIDQDSEGKGWILLHRALGSDRDFRPQLTLVDVAGAAIQAEQRFARRQEVADLRDELNDPAGSPCLRDQGLQVDSEHRARGSGVIDDPLRGGEFAR